MSEGYKMTELGEIPEGWEVAKLKDITTRITKGTTPTTLGYKFEEHGINFIKIESLSGNGNFLSQFYAHIDIKCHNKLMRSQLQEDDLLFSIAGALGRVAIVRDYVLPANTNQALAIIRLKNRKQKQYIYYFLKSDYIKQLIIKINVSTAQANLSLDNINNFFIALPPLLEQQKIAEILTTLDDKLDVIDAQINQTQELKKGLMQQLLTKGIGHKQFKDSPLGEIPESWVLMKLGDVLDNIIGGGTPSRNDTSFWKNEIPWATVKDLKKSFLDDTEEYISKEGLKNSASNLISKNTLIIATRMALGKAVFFSKDVAINQDLKAIIPSLIVDKYFLFHWFQHNSKMIMDMGSGSTVKGIRLEVLKSFNFILSPLHEQKKISKILGTVDEKLTTLDEKKQTYQQLKKGLMQQLLTGKIRVNHLIENEALA